MANYSKQTLARVGRMLNTGESSDPAPLVKLARAGAFGRKAIYNWSLPETDPQHRKMPRVAKRMIALLAYFSAAGLLNDKRLEEIAALEAVFENETETNATLRRMKRLLGGGKARAGAKAAGAAGAEEEDASDLDDDDHEHEHASPAVHPAPELPSAPVL